MILQNSADTLILNLQSDRSLVMRNENVNTTGTWRYDNSKGIIHLSGVSGNDFRNVVITRFHPNKIIGVHYEKKNYDKAVDVILLRD
jgi:hypothetical protein